MDEIVDISDDEDNGQDLEVELGAVEGRLHQVSSNLSSHVSCLSYWIIELGRMQICEMKLFL